MIDRSIAPEFKEIRNILFPEPEKRLAGRPDIWYINAGTQDVLKIECLFFAGTRFEHKPLAAFATNSTLKEGTGKMSSGEIAERLDFYGAFLENEHTKDTASITLYCLNKHLASCLPILIDMLTDAAFPEKEFDLFMKNNLQKFLVNRERVDYLARVGFNEMIFGSDSKYGYAIKEEDYKSLKREDVISLYKNRYDLSTAVIIVSGKIREQDRLQLESQFHAAAVTAKKETHEQTLTPFETKRRFIHKEGAVQSAIRVGIPLFNRRHPDYLPMLVLNTIFGGYFGSRLMANIREDKGYTYGVGSGINSLHQGGVFFISTEVGVDVTAAALNEIYFEMRRLREQHVPQNELDLVKNYMLGVFLRSMDGPFALSEKLKTLIEYGLDASYYQKFIETVNTITADEIHKLANRYLDPAAMYELVVGSVDPGEVKR